MEKVLIKEIKVNGDWYNIKDDKGRQISICLKDKTGNDKNPKLKPSLISAKEGDIIEMKVTGGTDNKFFGWDPDDKKGGGKSFAPQDKSFEAAKVAAQATASFHGLQKDITSVKLTETFELFHKLIMDKITIKPADAENK